MRRAYMIGPLAILSRSDRRRRNTGGYVRQRVEVGGYRRELQRDRNQYRYRGRRIALRPSSRLLFVLIRSLRMVRGVVGGLTSLADYRDYQIQRCLMDSDFTSQ